MKKALLILMMVIFSLIAGVFGLTAIASSFSRGLSGATVIFWIITVGCAIAFYKCYLDYQNADHPNYTPPEPMPDPRGFDYESCGMIHYRQYQQCTAERNWRGIFKINRPMVSTGFLFTKREMKRLHEFLEPDEIVFAFCSGVMPQTITSNYSDSGTNTWLVVLTSTRFLFLDHAFWTRAIDTQSIRHEHVQAVSASQGWVFGKIIIDLGARLVTVDHVGQDDVQIMAGIANRWYDTLRRAKEHVEEQRHGSIIAAAAAMVANPAESKASTVSIADELKKLADLRASGALSDDEFAEAKSRLLERI